MSRHAARPLVYRCLRGCPALVGWRLGNLHLPVEIAGSAVRVPHDPAVLLLCEREGWPVTEESVVFKPLRVVAHAS